MPISVDEKGLPRGRYRVVSMATIVGTASSPWTAATARPVFRLVSCWPRSVSVMTPIAGFRRRRSSCLTRSSVFG
jgi:hypothetical protein